MGANKKKGRQFLRLATQNLQQRHRRPEYRAKKMRSQFLQGGSDVAINKRGGRYRDHHMPGDGRTGDTVRRGRAFGACVARECDRPTAGAR